MKPNTETALGAALKTAVQSLSKKKQTEMIAEYVYSKFDVFRQFRPLALGIHKGLIAALPQFDPLLISRVVANHCRKPRYARALARGGKRFDLINWPTGEVSPDEKKAAALFTLVTECKKQAENSTTHEGDEAQRGSEHGATPQPDCAVGFSKGLAVGEQT